MPITWTIAPLEHMAVCVAEGPVTLADMLACLDALEKAGAPPYQKILIATSGIAELSDLEVNQLASRIAALRNQGPFGEVAVVAGPSPRSSFAVLLQTLSVDRPLRLFATIHDARRWLGRRRASLAPKEGD
jgi:hypothetical protein